MIPRASLQLEYATKECQQYAQYWHAIPKNGLVPNRSDFFPEEVPELLPNFIMHDFISANESIIRLIGTSIANRYSENITGRNYLDFVAEARKETAGFALAQMSEKPCGMRVLLRQKTKSGREYMSESLGFPLLNISTGRHLLLFQNIIIEDGFDLNSKPDQLVNLGVSKRDFIDIGAGIPDFVE